MIESITFQFQISKKFLNEELIVHRVIGDRNTVDLEELLLTDIDLFSKLLALVQDLNSDLNTNDVGDKIFTFTGVHPSITNVTKTKRNYFIGGLTIHEIDN